MAQRVEKPVRGMVILRLTLASSLGFNSTKEGFIEIQSTTERPVDPAALEILAPSSFTV